MVTPDTDQLFIGQGPHIIILFEHFACPVNLLFRFPLVSCLGIHAHHPITISLGNNLCASTQVFTLLGASATFILVKDSLKFWSKCVDGCRRTAWPVHCAPPVVQLHKKNFVVNKVAICVDRAGAGAIDLCDPLTCSSALAFALIRPNLHAHRSQAMVKITESESFLWCAHHRISDNLPPTTTIPKQMPKNAPHLRTPKSKRKCKEKFTLESHAHAQRLIHTSHNSKPAIAAHSNR